MAGGIAGGFITRALESTLTECSNTKYSALLTAIQSYIDFRRLLLPDITISISGNECRGAFGGNRGLRPVPPEKGVFPLDHLHLGDLEKKEYLNRLKFAGHKSKECRHLYRKYLECRMEKAIAGI